MLGSRISSSRRVRLLRTLGFTLEQNKNLGDHRMSLGRLENRLGALLAAATFTAVLATSGEAAADGAVTPTGKGAVGGALLGAEVVVIPMGAAGLNRGWPYFVFGGLGMVGGAVGGYFVEQATPNTPEVAIYMLAGGMALVIPALIISLNATAYRPPENDRVEPANNQPAKEPPKADPGAPPPSEPGAAPPPGATSASTPAPATRMRFRSEIARMPHIPTSLFDVYKSRLALGLPAIEVKPLYTQRELWTFGVGQGTEVRLPVFKAMF
jgi:hypothetical protein